MVNIECTRCHATGIDYPTYYVAKYTLTHERGCGAKIGIPSYTATGKAKPTLKEVEPVIQKAPKDEKLFSDVVKAKKKRLKKTDHSAL
jgi:hypothetical protein